MFRPSNKAFTISSITSFLINVIIKLKKLLLDKGYIRFRLVTHSKKKDPYGSGGGVMVVVMVVVSELLTRRWIFSRFDPGKVSRYGRRRQA
jgi:hypothetical protein